MRLDRSRSTQTLMPLRHLGWSEVVVRGGVEPPTFRFSGGFAGPGWSTISHLSGQNAVLLLTGVQDCRHSSRRVVSTSLARSAGPAGCRWFTRQSGLTADTAAPCAARRPCGSQGQAVVLVVFSRL